MINKEWSYYANFVRFPQNKYTTFTVGVKDRQTGKWKNYNIFSFGVADLKDGDQVKFTDFISIDQKEYQGKQQFSVTAEFVVLNNSGTEESFEAVAEEEFVPISNDEFVPVQEPEVVDDEPLIDISNDDLPF